MHFMYNALRRREGTACNKTADVNDDLPHCNASDSDQVINEKPEKLLACAAARTDLMNGCFEAETKHIVVSYGM